MSVLAIDTASRLRVVCVVVSAAGALIDAEVIRGRPVGTSLPHALARMLASVDRGVVVVTGPGTYTGVRAGMAAALGVAHARHLPLFGVGTLEVVASGDSRAPHDDDWVAADAGREALYVARRATASQARRVMVADFDPAGARVLSTDALPVPGVMLIDPAEALARSVELAVSRRELDRAGLSALHVD